MIKFTDHPKLEGVENISQERAAIQSDQEALVNASKQHSKVSGLKCTVAYLGKNSLQHTGSIKGKNLGNRDVGGDLRLVMDCKLGRSSYFDTIARHVYAALDCKRKATSSRAQRQTFRRGQAKSSCHLGRTLAARALGWAEGGHHFPFVSHHPQTLLNTAGAVSSDSGSLLPLLLLTSQAVPR